MSRITNYVPHWCMMDDINDKEWGCGWRSLQTMLSQLNIFKDVFTLGFEVKTFTNDPELVIDFDKPEISMADMSQLAPYFVSVAQTNGSLSANFDLLMVNNLEMVKKASQLLNTYFNESKSNVFAMIGTGGNVGLIGGYKHENNKDMVYLIDPHVNDFNSDFGDCNGIGRGGQGWVDFKETVLYGQSILGMDDDTFLSYSPALIATFNNIMTIS